MIILPYAEHFILKTVGNVAPTPCFSVYELSINYVTRHVKILVQSSHSDIEVFCCWVDLLFWPHLSVLVSVYSPDTSTSVTVINAEHGTH